MRHKVAQITDFKGEDLKSVLVDNTEIVIFRHADGSFSALEDMCSHQNVPLSSGAFENGEIECMAHGARFNCKTGQPLCMPATGPVKSYVVEVVGDDVFVLA